MREETLIQFSQKHLLATVVVAERALVEKDIRWLQQRMEGISDYPQDIVKRISHFLHEFSPPLPVLPEELEDSDEAPKPFAIRVARMAIIIAGQAAELTDLREIRDQSLLLLRIGDEAESRLRTFIKEQREK